MMSARLNRTNDYDAAFKRFKRLGFRLGGGNNVGKTSLLRAYASGRPNVSVKSTGLPEDIQYIKERVNFDGESCSVKIEDFRKSEQDTDMFMPMYSRYHGVFLVFALNDRDSFENLFSRFDKMLSSTPGSLRLIAPVVVLANKCDVPDDERTITHDVIQAWCSENGLTYFETSNRAVDAPAMTSAVEELVRRANAYETARRNRIGTFPR